MADNEEEMESAMGEQTEGGEPQGGDPAPPDLTETGGAPDEDQLALEEMFPGGIGEYEDEDEMDFAAKYGINDILGEIENEEMQEHGEGGDYLTGEYDEFLGEDGPDGPSVDQLEAMIKYLDDQKKKQSDSEEEQEGGCEDEEEQDYDEGRTEVTSISSPFEVPDEKPKMLMVLGPDHPKMVRFQRALKEHLERQIYLVETETRDLEVELKEKRRERTDMGTAMFNLQQEMLRQTELMEKYEKDLTKIFDKRGKMEQATEELKKTVDCLKEGLCCEENRERELVQSMKTLDYSEYVVRQAAEKYDGELKIRQFIDEKIERMKGHSEKQKRETDYYIDKVMTQIQQMEQINEGIQRQINAHLEEQKQMTTYINEAITEIEALQIEKIHLQRAWNETISVVKTRDDALMAARKAVAAMEEDLRIKESELKSLVRLITKEQEQHEHYLILLRRRKVDEKILNRQLQKLLGKGDLVKAQIVDLHKVKQELETQVLHLTTQLSKRDRDVNGPRQKIEKLSLEKIKLEDQILLCMQERSAMDKAGEHIMAKIKDARNKTRHVDSEVAKVENEMAQLTIDVERLRSELLTKQANVEELDKKLAKQDTILKEQLHGIQQSERVIQKKTLEIEHLNRKIQSLVKVENGVEVGPLEQELNTLRKKISQEKETLIQLQEEWLKRQDHLVLLTGQRDKILGENEMLRKEVFIMERKKQRLESELEKKRVEIRKLDKETEQLRKEIKAVNHKLHKDQFSQEQMDKDNILIQNELAGMLKDAEMEALELQQEIVHLETDKERLFVALNEAHETNLQWEKKVHLAKELKDNIKKEQETSMSGLKLAIHHMQVRFNELSRAQEKLMTDLERSIEHRDMIIQRADLSMKRANIHPTKNKLNVNRTLNQLQERNKHLLKEARDMENEIRSMMAMISEIEEKLKDDTTEIDRYKEAIQESELKIQEASIQKHKNLLEVILRQQKYKTLESVKLRRFKPLAKNVDDMKKLIDEVEGKCYSLVELSERLAEDYPEASLHAKLVKASILAGA